MVSLPHNRILPHIIFGVNLTVKFPCLFLWLRYHIFSKNNADLTAVRCGIVSTSPLYASLSHLSTVIFVFKEKEKKEFSNQKFLSFKHLSSLLVVGQFFFHYRPELFRVIHLFKVRNFVNYHVIDSLFGIKHKVKRNANVPFRRA